MLLAILIAASLLSTLGICLAAEVFSSAWWPLWLLLSAVGSVLAMVVLAFVFMVIACALVDQEKPQKHDSKFYRTLSHLYIDAIMKVAKVHLHTTGMEQVPQDGRFMLVCNHVHDSDPVMLLTAFRDSQLAFISKRENKTMPFVGKLMHKMLCQLINRENDREALKTILNCVRILEEDKASVAVFPEGYIYDDRKLHHFRPGVFKIATKTKVPIVVCTLRGTHEALPKAMRLKRSEVEVRLLQVIYPEEYENMTTVELSEQIYARMAADLGPELVSEG